MPIDHLNALPPGTRFEEYRLDSVLGSGGFGITYRAYDANLEKFVAIKEYLPNEFATRAERYTVVPQSSTDAQDYHWGLNRFLDEARTLARFDHPHLNKVHRFFESNGTAYMVLEYVEGETLADRLSRERQLPEESLQRLLDEVLYGLSVMHDAGYVHRDIKPGNLMLREKDGSAVVLDFGAARQAVGQRSKAITSILTPGYAPIEQYDSKADDVGPWSDIYALGMVAYRCISGVSDSELPDAVTRGRTQRKGGVDLTSATEAGKGQYNAGLLEAIDWAIEVDEEDRPQTVGEWQRVLAGQGRRQGTTKPVRQPSTQTIGATTTGRSGLSWTAITLTMAIIALLGVGGWWSWQEYPELFGQGADDTRQSGQQAITTDVPGETLQETDSGETVEAVAGSEQAQPTEMAETEQPTPKEPVLSPEEAEVARLLAGAEADLKARRLTSPAGNNAWEKYQQVISLSPSHPDAMAGMERVIGSYMELFGASVEQEEFEQAESYLSRIADLHPDSPALVTGKKQLADARQARKERLAEQARQRQAEEAARQAELERQWTAQAIRTRWEAFEAALQAGDVGEAAAVLVQVRELNPEEPGLAAAEQRLAELAAHLTAQALNTQWASFEAALAAEDVEAAANSLAGIRELDPDAPGLTDGEQRLEEMRQALEAKMETLVGEMVSIPGGTFRMGDIRGDGWDDEKPVHSVTVPSFRMGKYEVTVGQFRRFVEATGYRTDAERNSGGNKGCLIEVSGFFGSKWDWVPDHNWRNPGHSIDENHPVVCVSWNDAEAFVEWLTTQTGKSFRLPTEAEWEYAARAGSTTKYSWGNSIGSNRANCDGCGSRWDDDRTAPVGSFSANAWGLHDMHGNVWEWVQDCWNDSYAGAPTDGGAWMSGDCSQRVIRGGSWYNKLGGLRSANRTGASRSSRDDAFGLRLAQDK